jgi:hypothetical protein
MSSLEQRWLSLQGICDVLSLTPNQARLMHKQRYLVRVGKRVQDHRYLDPTPEYAERLRLAAVLLSKNNEVRVDLPMTFILTVREVAEIMGWSLKYAQRYLSERKIPCLKSKNRVQLFTVSTVRDLIWQRSGKKLGKYVGPILLSEMIDYFRRFQAAEDEIMPTDAALDADAALQKKISWILRQPHRDKLLAAFLEKVEIAKQVTR